MTIRNTGSRRLNNEKAPSRHRNRLQNRKRRQDRRTLLEALEQRQLLAAGPQLTGIQPNEGSLLFDGSTLTVAPRELVFRFDDTTTIDPATLDGIRITRAGADGIFESATATTDFGTGGVGIVEFRSLEPGASGNGQLVRLTSVNRVGTRLPIVRLTGGVVEIELNSNPVSPTRIQDLTQALASSVARDLVQAVVVSGSTLTPIGTQIGGSRTLTLQGANAAQALTELGTTDGTLVRLIAQRPGPEGRGVTITVTRRDFGGPANPVVTVQGQAIRVQVNSTAGFASTVNDFIAAINGNPEASQLVTAVLESGSGATSLANLPTGFAPLVLAGAGDEVLTPGYVGLGDSAREVVFRFSENLPDDTYRIDILGSGAQALTNAAGEAFNNGTNLGLQFELNLGPQVAAVVPEPVRRAADGTLSPSRGIIEVHFNNDDLLQSAAQNVNFYQLIFTASNGSDVAIKPTSVSYSPLTNIATLNFGRPLSGLLDPTSATGAFLQGAFRLKVGTSGALPADAIRVNNVPDGGDSFVTAFDLSGSLGTVTGGTKSLIIDGSIRNSDLFPFELPGGQNSPGRRELRPDDPTRLMGPAPLDYYRLDANGDLVGDADNDLGITQFVYNFQSNYLGPDPVSGGQKTYFNVITEQQKERVREAMTMFSEYLGIQFVESANLGTTIVAGDLYSASGDAVSAQGGAVAALRIDGPDADSFPDLGVLDFQDFDESDDDSFGDQFSRGAFLLVGQLIGYGYADNLPQPVTQSTTFVLNPGADAEATFPSVADIVHGQYLYRPESADIDLYQFTLDAPGRVAIETFAERADQVSLLDTALRLYRVMPSGDRVEIAANDDYSSNDSLIEMDLEVGTYYVGVSASGNTEYDPTISGTGFGGRSEGDYQLRLTVRPTAPQGLVDTTGIALDGDADGKPGGEFNFWYRPAEPFNPSLRQFEINSNATVTPGTIFVDKAAVSSTGNGSLQAPFRNIDDAMAIARDGDIVRVLANGGADGKISTGADNLSYQVGVDPLGRELADGASIQVPGGVTMVVDAGAVIKFRNSFISVGSSSPSINRAGGALQILGTPLIVESNGQIATNLLQEPIPGSVFLTSYYDTTVGAANSPTGLPARAGDWGGIDFRSDLDVVDESRVNLEASGIFLNQIYGANIRYGGGQVSIAGQQQSLSPISIDVTRPTIAYSTLSQNASAAISATPDSFIESTFMDYVGANEVGKVSDIHRIGPDIHNNRITDNSLNGMLIRVTTRTGEGVKPLTGQARFDDVDVVHVLSENLIIQGTPGGPIVESLSPPSLLIRSTPLTSGSLAAGQYVYKVAYVDANGNNSRASEATLPVTVAAGGAVRLDQLPIVPAGTPFTARRLYRAPVDATGVVGDFRLAANLNGNSTTFTDNGSLSGAVLVEPALQLRSRPDARLAIDAGTVIKLDGSRIETTFGAQLIAEGTDGMPIVMTSLNDGRFGAAGSFKTDGQSEVNQLTAGDWSGIYVGYGSSASLDHVRIAGAGGISRIAGQFASFNPIEVHQGDLRLTNSRFEDNADGRALPAGQRFGLAENSSGTLFVRGATPTVVNNVFINGEGAAITIDVNSLGFQPLSDSGRSTGALEAFDIRGNVGPLVQGNQLADNGLNGMLVRGGQTTTEVVFDDTDIVHIVTDTIEVPNQHIFGGLRLVSSPDASLVVKFESRQSEPAGIVVGGSLLTAVDQLVDIQDRIGGSLQLVGFPDFPVVLTTLADDSVGAGFTPDGQAQVDTNNDGLFGANQPTVDGFAQLPFGPEVNNGTRIDNDISVNIPGFFQAEPLAGGSISFLGGSGVTIDGIGGIQIDQDYIFEFLNMIDVGPSGDGFSLESTTITQPPTLIADDRVESRGQFNGQNGVVNWTVQTYFENGVPVLFNTITFDSATSLGALRLINYLDEDVEFPTDDIMFTRGTPGEADFRVFTIDGARRIGFSQGGFYETGNRLSNATYIGWTADVYRDLLDDIEGGNGTQYTIPGNIDLQALPARVDAQLGQIYGPNDVTTAFAWDVDPTAFSASITTFLEVIPRDPSAPTPQVQSGLWDGVTIREAASDRNVVGTPENEAADRVGPGANGVPGAAQFLGELAAESRGGDENQRLGFVVDGQIATRDDLDVYSFIGRAGSEVWFDIDRTQMSLDSVVELIDANGFVLASSDNSAAESVAGAVNFINDRIDPEAAKPMNKSPLTAATLTAAQDQYSTNPRDAGMRITLPGESGTRNLYHLRVRSSNGANGDVTPDGPNSPLVSAGLTKGGYRLQVRLREADEFPGTQVRFGDLRYAQTNLEIIGQPFHSPLIGDAQETASANNLRANAQPIGPYSLSADQANAAAANILASDRLALTVGGSIDSATDVDWYQFSINSQGLPAGATLNYLSTVFDLDYADGYARADMSLYVFDSQGRLILAGLDSNIADDQPRPDQGADSTDLSRGSAGTNDPYIGMTELAEGTYFVAVSNHTQVPAVLNQYYADATNPNVAVDPLLRLEPVTSVRRLVEDHIGGGRQTVEVPGSPGGPQLLFNNQSIVPLTLDDLVMYTMDRTGNGTQSNFSMANPFNGQNFGTVGLINPDIRDFAVRPNGEFFAYSSAFTDTGWIYYRISSEDGSLTPIGPTTLQTFQEDLDGNGNVVVNVSDTGLRIPAITFADSDFGYFIANRSDPSPGNPNLGPDYTENILYLFDAETGQPISGPQGDRAPFTVGGVTIDPRANGAGTQIRERGFINTSASAASTTINVGPATTVTANGTANFTLRDGTSFAFRDANGTLYRFEFNSGPDFRMRYDSDSGIFVRDGDQLTLNGVVYEFETGGSIVTQAGTNVADGATIQLTSSDGSLTRTFELNNNSTVVPGNIPVAFTTAMTAGQVADALAAAINASGLGITADALGATGRIGLVGESTATPPVAAGNGLTFEGGDGISAAAAVEIALEEGVSFEMFVDGIRAAAQTPVAVGVAGDRVNFRGAVSGNDFSQLVNRGIILTTPGNPTGALGNGTVSAGSTGIGFLASDTAATIAARIANAVNQAAIGTVTAAAAGRSVTFTDAILNRNEIESAGSPIRLTGVAPGGSVTGIAMIGGQLFAVSNAGGLFVVNTPNATVQGQIGSYVASSTDLLGINFSGLSQGPNLNYVDSWSNPGTTSVRSMSNLLFGSDTAGNIYAFNTSGVLQPIFAGGATSVATGRGGTTGIELSTLDYNLWHVTGRRGLDDGHGVTADPFGTRDAVNGNNSLYFGYAQFEGGYQPQSASGNNYSPATSPLTRPRQDGQQVDGTYNFPGGAAGAIESMTFSLEGYAAQDLPFLYFNYFLGTDGVDGTNDGGQGLPGQIGGIDDNGDADRDALNVYVVTPAGQSILVATNNSATRSGFGDDALDPVDGANVNLLFDNSGWRQARVPLAAFAGMSDLRLRVEFATAGQMTNGSQILRTVAADRLSDGRVVSIGGRNFELDFGPIITLPGGSRIADYYAAADAGVPGSQPSARVTVVVDGLTFVLSDGRRTVAPGEVEVLMTIADDPATPADESRTIRQLTADDVATLLEAAIDANQPAPTTIPGVIDFSNESNDELARATQLPRAVGNTVINGNGRIGSADGVSNLNDVDLSRIRLSNGESLTVDVTRTGGLVNPTIRIFDSAGREVASASGTSAASVTYTATAAGDYFIGINGGGTYNPSIAGSGQVGFGGTYDVVVSTATAYDAIRVGNRIQVVGVATATTNESTIIGIAGAVGVSPGAIRIPVQIDMTADEIAVALQAAISNAFSGGSLSAFPTRGGVIELGNLNVTDAGPFAVSGSLTGDSFGALGPGRAVNNANEGVYLDDFVVGFAERGELVTGSSINDVFAPNLESRVSNPAQPVSPLVTGSYQLEIRDASEYATSSGSFFRTIDTNDRMVDGVTTLVAPAANTILDGTTFTLSDGSRTLTFEFDQIGSVGGVAPGRVAIPFDATTQSLQSAGEVADAIVDAINQPSVQSLIDVSALLATGVDSSVLVPRINLFGQAIVTDPSGLFEINVGTGRGDANRERDDQGVIIVENSSFSFAAEYGIDINHSGTSTVDGQTVDNLVRYPRNLVELNADGTIPGVVVQSNTIAYSRQGGIRITGLSDTGSAINPLPFDRIVNNTIVGGTITPGETTPAEVFQGLLFPAGSVSFADAVVAYNPLAGGGPQPEAGFRDATQALGAPDALGGGPEPTVGDTTVSLGYGGTLTLQFTDNVLTGDGTPAPDLVVFEVGAIESVGVEVSRDGVTFVSVGTVGGLSNRIDIDAFGFTPQDRLAFVRLTDLRQGDRNSLTVGADIDAVGALSTVAADVYTPGGTGVLVQNNAAPSLINNVIANNVTGISADTSSQATVSGGNVLYRNSTNISGAASLGQFTQVVSPAANIFVSPTELVFDPASGSPLIDSSIDSLPDRSGLVTVRGPLGLERSPILAPRFDVHGQLRIDDPTVDSPSGLGENIFKDRGAADRADQSGPVGRLVLPGDNDAAGVDRNPAVNTVTVTGSPVRAFEIQLIDGIAPNDPVPGVGIADGSVTGTSVLVLRDNVPLVEGVDYSFGYQPSTNTIRITPLAGVWQEDATYTIRLLDAGDRVVVASAGDQYQDGALLNVVDAAGGLDTLEIETGISISVPTAADGTPLFTDGATFSIFDGVREVFFEIDTNAATLPGRNVVSLRTNMTLQDVTAAYVSAINSAGLGLTATASDGARIQLMGSNVLSSVDPLDSGLTVAGSIGVSAGYGLQVPTLNGAADTLIDGETFAIRRGAFQVTNFELTTDGVVNNVGYIPVTIPAAATLDQIANALVVAIGGSGLGLDPVNAGFGRVRLGGDASYSIELTNTNLMLMGVPGQQASVAVPISIAPNVTANQVALQLQAVIEGLNPQGVTTSVVGPRVILDGAIGISGIGAVSTVSIRDRVGNLLQSNTPAGTTEFTVILGSGFDYGDATQPKYTSSQADGGPRHALSDGLVLGTTVTPEADAIANDGDNDDGIRLLGPAYTGFDASFQIEVTADGGPFVLDYWVDWNGDGVFAAAERGARLTSSAGLSNGVNNVSIPVPTLGTAADQRPVYSVAGETFARFRLSRDGVDSPLGDAPNGEVEDFAFTIQVNPFQNPGRGGRWDVNASGDVSPIDALQVINELNRRNQLSIQLDPTMAPAGPPYLDVNGDGVVNPTDALAVINYIENVVLGRAFGRGGEGEGSSAPSVATYMAAGPGVMASAATMFGTPSTSGLQAEGEGGSSSEIAGTDQFDSTPAGGQGVSRSTVFDSAASMALDDILDSLASENRDSATGEGDDPYASLDAVFDQLGG
jgi:hypothetical protein